MVCFNIFCNINIISDMKTILDELIIPLILAIIVTYGIYILTKG